MLASTVLQALATPKPSHRTATWYSVIHHPTSHVSNCSLSSVHHFRWCLAFTGKMFDLWTAARPWYPIPLNSRHTVIVLAVQFIALQNSRVIVSPDVWRVSRTTFKARGCPFTFPLHNHVTNHRLGQLEKGCSVPDRFLTDVASNN
jgi:hypothetical protein